jgi:putative phosphoesterase
MKIGVISDTHGHLDPKVFKLFAGVDHILHGGDIGLPVLILELEEIAPVTAVLGNNDVGMSFRETEVKTLGERTVLVHHIVNPHRLVDPVAERIRNARPNIVVFGHTHQPFNETIEDTLFLNPGYSGKPRFAMPRSVAVLHLEASGPRVEFHSL